MRSHTSALFVFAVLLDIVSNRQQTIAKEGGFHTKDHTLLGDALTGRLWESLHTKKKLLFKCNKTLKRDFKGFSLSFVTSLHTGNACW